MAMNLYLLAIVCIVIGAGGLFGLIKYIAWYYSNPIIALLIGYLSALPFTLGVSLLFILLMCS